MATRRCSSPSTFFVVPITRTSGFSASFYRSLFLNIDASLAAKHYSYPALVVAILLSLCGDRASTPHLRGLEHNRLMNVLHTSPRTLPPDDVPPYAILSHTWGPDEVVFADLAYPKDDWKRKTGFGKIRSCAEQAKQHGLWYF
ncbi:hypothetical protein M406DRAFT_75495 [Cryphonectria parasitica EP155]|uniref:Uncharacterized protein n=1 Tax=Cryphonectria parasitica (strain ATCC 38755 / EP155) TaxID=660469 RepID=A0A9P4Y8Y9_CRYP1|nr:uncharacterized protein M406DRAFT_75495 [Cryphonectria parasitica EP155]KAF3768240.1 hypothetical protein M406DRAFT_75495 [Cryphonectria parasitica EP155]